jgi:uncharacterized protein
MNPDRDDRIALRLGRIALILSAVLAVLVLAFPAGAAPKFPALAGRVTDAANILPPETEAALEARLKQLEATTTTQFVVATVPDLQGYEIDEYGYQLGRSWGIGQKGTNNGALLIVAPNERKVRIEAGYGLEGVLTDAMTSQIIRRNIIPYFKAGDMAGGVNAGADAVIKLLELPPEERAKVAQAAAIDNGGGGPGAGFIIWLIIILFWIVLAISRRKRGLRAGPAVVWGPGMGGWGGSSGGGWGGGGGGGGFGGGGFGGGGGSFGGGGSSGSW